MHLPHNCLGGRRVRMLNVAITEWKLPAGEPANCGSLLFGRSTSRGRSWRRAERSSLLRLFHFLSLSALEFADVDVGGCGMLTTQQKIIV